MDEVIYMSFQTVITHRMSCKTTKHRWGAHQNVMLQGLCRTCSSALWFALLWQFLFLFREVNARFLDDCTLLQNNCVRKLTAPSTIFFTQLYSGRVSKRWIGSKSLQHHIQRGFLGLHLKRCAIDTVVQGQRYKESGNHPSPAMSGHRTALPNRPYASF